MVGSLLGIGFLSFIVWGHHMFVTGMNPFLGSVFVFTTLLIAIPSAVKAFNYITTLWQGNIRFTPAMLFSIGLVSTFVTGWFDRDHFGRLSVGRECPRHVLRSSPLPHRYGDVCDLWNARRDLPLVSKDVWAHDEHQVGLCALLGNHRMRVRRVFPDALCRYCWGTTALLRVQ